LTLYAADERDADQAADVTMTEVWRIEEKYSRYLDNNALAAINAAALAGEKVEVDAETAELFNYAFAAYQLSTGLFDVSSGVLRRAWDFSSGQLPSQSSLEQILPLIGLGKVAWVAPQLDFLQAGMELDFGGIGKEYAVDRAAEVCLAAGIQSGLLDFGGDIRALGPHPDGSPWLIGIRHPRHPDLSLGNFQLMSGAVATSGDYERYLEVAGKRYCHILNPLTGWPAHGLCSVTVAAEQCLLAGTLATIAMLKEEGGKHWLAELGARHCWVDGELRVGGNMELHNVPTC
jgi:thiamine biosynthesis lipoprotein